MSQISVSDIKVDVVRKNIKNIHLAVYPPNGRVRISVPLFVKEDTIKLFVTTKLSWIRRQQKKFNEQPRQTVREFKDKESHYYQGKRYLLKVVELNAPPNVKIQTANTLALYVRPGSTLEKRNEVINKWYREKLREEIPELIDKWEKILKVKVNEFGIKQMKTRWGTCNTRAKRIWLNLELAKKPLHCLEYIVVHEMIHLIERKHNDRFKELMTLHMPKWKQYKSELNKFPVSHSEWEY